jgi:hypothetical protein
MMMKKNRVVVALVVARLPFVFTPTNVELSR